MAKAEAITPLACFEEGPDDDDDGEDEVGVELDGAGEQHGGEDFGLGQGSAIHLHEGSFGDADSAGGGEAGGGEGEDGHGGDGGKVKTFAGAEGANDEVGDVEVEEVLEAAAEGKEDKEAALAFEVG